jgi:aminoglycoside phosphotransferase (APT) family kinase protein
LSIPAGTTSNTTTTPAPTPPPTLTDAELRRAPSREALARLCATIQPGGRVGAVRRLRGGISSGMHAVDLIGPGGEHRWVVVRRYGAWRLEHDPQVAEQEWATLTALGRVGAPTPSPIWLDPSGELFGCPTIVTSRVPGRGLLAPRDVEDWIRQLAEALAQIHAAPLTDAELGVLIDQRPRLASMLEGDDPPSYLSERPGGTELWAAMRRSWPGIQPVAAPTIVHGDYWPGNTLWRYGKLSGVIDWEQVRRGDPAQDVGCCRLDLTLLIGPEAAELFLRTYEAATGRAFPHLYFWELYMASWAMESLEHWIEGYHDLGRTDLSVADVNARFERFVARALAEATAKSPTA